MPGGGQVVQSLEQLVEPLRDARAAGLREAAGGGDVRDRQDARHDLDVHAGCGDLVLKTQEAVRREEKLRDRPVGAGVDLALQIVEIGPAIGGVGVDLGIGRDRNVERRDALEAVDQLGGIGVAVRMRCVSSARFGRVAAQGDDVPHAKVPIIAGDCVDFVPRRSDAGQVRGGRERGFLEYPLDRRVRAVAGRAAGSVGHRHEPRLERRERLDRVPQGLRHLLRLRREEFEAEGDVAVGLGEQRLVVAELLERMAVHAALRCGTASLTPRHRVTVSSPPFKCST